MQESLNKYMDMAVQLLMAYGPKLVLAVVTLIVGLWLIGIFVRGFDKAMDRAKVGDLIESQGFMGKV